MHICAHTLVRNEERYLWFSVMSVIDYVDKILIWDTGSSDNTIKIVKEIKKNYSNKVEFEEVEKVSAEDFPLMRQKMLEKTASDWVLIVDGDEVWWDGSIRQIVRLIYKEGDFLETVVNRYFNIVGDIFHYQPESAGMYMLDGFKGHLNIRAMNRKIPGLYAAKPHGQQGYFDSSGLLVQQRSSKKRRHINTSSYLHFTHMQRSFANDSDVPKRNIKYKTELGKAFPLNFYYPEVFFIPRPYFVPSPWVKMTSDYYIKALVETPIRKFKRRLIRTTSGY